MSASQSLFLEKRQNATSSSIYIFTLLKFFSLVIYRNFIFQVRLTWKDMSPFRCFFFFLNHWQHRKICFFFLCSLFQPIISAKSLHSDLLCSFCTIPFSLLGFSFKITPFPGRGCHMVRCAEPGISQGGALSPPSTNCTALIKSLNLSASVFPIVNLEL